METGNKRKWQIRVAVLAIFLLGFLAGAMTLNIYHARRLSSLHETRRDRFEQILDRLNLTQEQRTQVEQIIKDARSRIIEMHKQSEPRIGEIRRQTDERLQTVLTPQQWQQWRQMTGEMRARKRRDRER
jgi:Spy/CpxP family protein refolding chaperone